LIQEPYARRACLGWCGAAFEIPLALLNGIAISLSEAEEERLPDVQARIADDFVFGRQRTPLALEFADGETDPGIAKHSRIALQAHRNLEMGTVVIKPYWPRWRNSIHYMISGVSHARWSGRPADEEALFVGTLDPEAYALNRYR
jgi:hypothetical protein